MNDLSSIFSDVSWLMKEMLAMNISGYIGEIYFPGLRNVMTYHLWQLNINLLSICRQLLITIQDYRSMKEMDWYSLKMCTHKMHRIYRLLDKLISVICPSHIFPKCTFHHLQYGPRPIEINVLILDSTLAAIHKQLNFLYEENFHLEQSSRMNQLAFILHKSNKYLRHFVDWYESFSGHFLKGYPVMLNFE